MAEEEFNPYHKWLGIPPAEQPPNHYRLLGIELFETDHDVIESAADQRMAHLRTFQGGKKAVLSQNLLNEVSRARICLLNEKSKATYDTKLRSQSSPSAPKPDESTPKVAAPKIPSVSVSDDLPRYRRKKTPIWVPIVALAAFLVIGVGSVIAVIQMKGNDPEKQTGQNDPKKDNLGKKSKTNPDAPSKKSEMKTGKKSPSNPEKKNSTEPSKTGDPDKSKKPGNSKNKDSNSKPKDSQTPKNKTQTNGKPKQGDKPENQPKNPTPEKKKEDEPLIIPTKGTKKMAVAKRGPPPAKDKWKLYVVKVNQEYDLKPEMNRDARYSVFQLLIRDGVDEVRSEKAFAIFSAAMDQAKKLGYAAGCELYCTAFVKRFEFDKDRAYTAYLTSIAKALDSKSDLPKFLVESQKRIRLNEEQRLYQLAGDLLEAIVQLAETPSGKDINSTYFSMWLKANRYRQRLVEMETDLKKLAADGQPTPEQNRLLGAFECFVNKDFGAGLKFFESCDFKPLADTARKEQEIDNANIRSLLDVADSWWSLAGKTEDEELLFKLRAKHWYEQYAQFAGAAEVSRKITKRLEELELGIGLKRISNPRTISSVSLLDWEKEVIPLGDADDSAPRYMNFLSNGVLGLIYNETKFGVDGTRVLAYRLSDGNHIFEDAFPDFIDHGLDCIAENLALMKPRQGLTAIAIKTPTLGGQPRVDNLRRFRTPETIRAFDIGDKGDVFALANKFIYWWNPQQAWAKSPKRQPTRFDSPATFIPDRIQVIPNSSFVALANERNLVQVNPVSQSLNQLHSGAKIVDFDFAASGYVIALENGLRYKSFKGNKDLFFPSSKPIQVLFLGNPKFIVSIHEDKSLRIWDTSSKDGDYLMERFDSAKPEFKRIAISPDQKTLAVADSTLAIRLFQLFYE